MRITQLRLENFKSFKEPTTIDFAPITLLFGPNSAGKSSILQALDILKSNRFLTGNEYKELYSMDGTGALSIGATVDIGDNDILEFNSAENLNNYLSIYEEANEECFVDFGKFTSLINELTTVFNFSYLGYEDHFDIFLNKDLFFKIKRHQSKFLTEIDYINMKLNEWVLSEINFEHALFKDKDFSETFELAIDCFGVDVKSGQLIFSFEESILSERKILNFGSMQWSEQYGVLERQIFQSFWGLLLNAPIEALRTELNSFKHLGPLRVVPDQLSDDSVLNSYDGSLAWNMVGGSSDLFGVVPSYEEVNRWLHKPSESHFKKSKGYSSNVAKALSSSSIDSGYEIQVFDQYLSEQEFDPTFGGAEFSKELAEEQHIEGIEDVFDLFSEEVQAVSKETYIERQRSELIQKRKNEEIEALRVFKTQSKLKFARSVKFRNVENNHLTCAKNIGVGISQVLPVVAYSVDTKTSLMAVQQPELHLHPRMQSPLADMFIEESLDLNQKTHSPKKTFLVETHSEHIVLRLLRRIREDVILPDNISVLYIENLEGSSVVKQLRIDEEGDFIDEWPNGFFDERDEELF